MGHEHPGQTASRCRPRRWAANTLVVTWHRAGWPRCSAGEGSGLSRARGGQRIQPLQPVQGLAAAAAAHVCRRPERDADRRPLGQAKQLAAPRRIELHASHAGRLAVGHAGYRAADGRCDTTGGATGPAGDGITACGAWGGQRHGGHGSSVWAVARTLALSRLGAPPLPRRCGPRP